MVMTIYTDGGCWPNPGRGGWAAIVVNGQSETVLVGSGRHTTNQRMEIRAALSGLEAAGLVIPGNRLTIVTDSKYLQLGATKWITRWKKRGWRTAEKTPVLHRDLWERIDALLELYAINGVIVEWQWQRGHAGHVYNERCDRLASLAARALENPTD
jgi:ribonuclease HI